MLADAYALFKHHVESNLHSDLNKYHDEHDTYTSRAAASLSINLFKKAGFNTAQTKANAINEFKESNSMVVNLKHCCSPDYRFRAVIDRIIQMWDDLAYRYGNRFVETNDGILAILSLGSGSNVGSDGTHFYQKLFSGPLAANNKGMVRLYKAIISSSPLLAAAECERERKFGPIAIGCATMNTVPKNDKIDRVIFIETAIAMIFQKFLDSRFREILELEFGIDMETQPWVNQDLAKRGSIDGLIATLDLKRSSDNIRVPHLDLFLSGPYAVRLKAQIMSYRSSEFLDENGDRNTFSMVCGMGNGYCSSFQTLFYAIIAKAFYAENRIGWFSVPYYQTRSSHTRSPAYEQFLGGDKPLRVVNSRTRQSNVGVFGDDIVLVTSLFEQVTEFFVDLKMEPNMDKSFATGPFRESCGFDAFHGVNIRPVYLSGGLDEHDIYLAINQLNEWSARTGLLVPNTMRYLHFYLKTVLEREPIFVPLYEADDAGIRCLRPPGLYDKSQFKGGINKYTALRPREAFFDVSDTARSVDFGLDHVYIQDSGWTDKVRLKILKRTKRPEKLRFNESGILASVLLGKLRRMRVPIRQKFTRYTRCTVKGPSWGTLPVGPRGIPTSVGDIAHLERAIINNYPELMNS